MHFFHLKPKIMLKYGTVRWFDLSPHVLECYNGTNWKRYIYVYISCKRCLIREFTFDSWLATVQHAGNLFPQNELLEAYFRTHTWLKTSTSTFPLLMALFMVLKEEYKKLKHRGNGYGERDLIWKVCYCPTTIYQKLMKV